MAEHAPGTRADWAHQRLKAAILTGELAPGTKLVVDELSQRWAVSPTPLREAFQRLGGHGLVELTSQRGARVVWDTPAGSQSGITEGIDERGGLLVRVAADRVERIVAGEVRWI